MKIAIIDKKGAIIKVENQVLKVDEQKIPLRLIDTIILASNNHRGDYFFIALCSR